MNERDPLSFLLHDLVHAFKMFSNPTLLKSQVGFYKCALRLIDDGYMGPWLTELKRKNDHFAESFDYLISDMNSHAKHLFFFFKAILINAFKDECDASSSDKVLSGGALAEFNRIFDVVLDVFVMNEVEKISARSMLTDLVPFESFDFIVLDAFFNKISISS